MKKRPMYPNGREIEMAGDIVLEDRARPFKFFPIIEMPNYINPGEHFAMSDVDQIKELQKPKSTDKKNKEKPNEA